MLPSFFRSYDLRGQIGTELVLDEVYALGCAVAAYCIERKPGMRAIALARDGRTHSPAIMQALAQAFCDSGLDVLDLGICPTPVMYFTLHKVPVDAGVMVTASHNGPEYNGLKINLGTETVWGSEIQNIHTLYKARATVKAQQRGSMISYPMIDRYITWLVEQFPHLHEMQQSVLFDCGHGATAAVLPELIVRMGWPHARAQCAVVDGTFPAHEADPTVEQNVLDLRSALVSQQATLGIGFDGDGDRMAPLTHTGQLILGDKLLMLYAQQLLQKEPEATVLYDIKCSHHIERAVCTLNGRAIMCPTGHSIIKSLMRTHQAALAGELSCHFMFADRYFGYDDGIYAALRLLELIESSGKTLDELVGTLPPLFASREARMACSEGQQEAIVQHVKNYFTTQPEAELVLIDGIRINLPYGWILVRASHTQPVVCIRCEANSPESLEQLQTDLIEILSPWFSATQLRNAL